MNNKGKGSTSLAEWMINNLGEDSINTYWSSKNIVSPWVISYGSNSYVWIKCQEKYYHDDYQTIAKIFSKGHKCPYCHGSKTHPLDSFAQWGTDTLDKDFLVKYWSDKNTVNPWELSKGSVRKIYIKCQNKEYHEDYLVTPGKFIGNRRCPSCRGLKVHPRDSFAQWCADNIDKDFISKYWSIKNKLDPWSLSVKSNKKVWISCQNKEYHEDYEVNCYDFTDKNIRCPYCRGMKVHPKDSLGTLFPKSVELWSNKNKKSPFQYTKMSYQEVWWKCENGNHGDYKRKINYSNIYDFRCPSCTQERDESFLQEKVRVFIKDILNLKILHEHYTDIKCVNPKTNHILPYDNEVRIDNKNKLIVEVHGKQHYELSGFSIKTASNKGVTPEEEFEYLQWKDQYKKEYALSIGYHYLEVPYWTDNEDDEWKTLILNKLNEINNKIEVDYGLLK